MKDHQRTRPTTNGGSPDGRGTPAPQETAVRNPHTSDHLANERTFLAWVRTAVSIIGLGFVVSKFGLFLKGLAIGNHNIPPTSSRSAVLGVVLVGLGALTVAGSLVRYLRTRHQIETNGYEVSDWIDIGVALLITLCAIALMIVLLTTTLRG